ncbi:MAG: NAD(P)/FAD-dependent oxidoreductase [Paraclostridium sp.]
MVYDYIIAGSGIAGSICAYELSRKDKTCLILEKEAGRFEKICGGGVSYKAIELLEDIGIDIEKILDDEVSIVQGHTIFYKNNSVTKEYKDNMYSLGTTRQKLDSFLLEQALKKGAKIKYNEEVTEISKKNDLYTINGYESYNFVCAVGARGINVSSLKKQTVGISAQIKGKSNLESNKFYYWYYSDTDEKYFWIFPIGKDIWNIGVWFRNPDKTMKTEFEDGINKFVNPNFNLGYEYIKLPKGEFLGNIDQRDFNIVDGIGDFSGNNNIKNGGGIIGAIKSAIEYSNNQQD